MLDKYLITIDDEFGDDLGISKISFVSKPAIKVMGMAFNTNVKTQKVLFASDEKKMRIIAPAIIPMDIYRYSTEEDYEYEVTFTKEVVEKIRNKFMANLSVSNNIFNIEHTEELVPAFILETWIVGKEPEKDKAFSEFNIKVPSGTLMIMSQITDKDYYNKIVEEQLYAFSIEGFFGLDELKLMIDNKKEIINMEENKMPDGEYIVGDKIYVWEDGVVSVKDVEVALATDETVKEDEKTDEVKAETEEEKKEEVTAEETKSEDEKKEEVTAEEAPVEAPVAETSNGTGLNEAEVMALLEPKFEEIFNMIADLNGKLKDDEVVEDKTEEVEMSIHQRFSMMSSFLKNNRNK